MNSVWSLTTVATLLFCGVVFAGEISELHRQLPKPDPKRADQSRSHEEVEAKNHGVSEVGLERPAWYFLDSPVYTVVIKSDGTFRYVGERNVEHVGKHTGKVSADRFNELAQFIREIGYGELQDSYSRRVTDNPTAYSTAVINGKRKVISNYANAGPTKLWAVEQLIDKLLLEARWDEEKPAAPK